MDPAAAEIMVKMDGNFHMFLGQINVNGHDQKLTQAKFKMYPLVVDNFQNLSKGLFYYLPLILLLNG